MLTHAQLLLSGAASGRDGLGLVGTWMPYPYGKKQRVTHTSAKRQVSGAVNLLLLRPTAVRLPGNPEASQIVVWVWLLCFTFWYQIGLSHRSTLKIEWTCRDSHLALLVLLSRLPTFPILFCLEASNPPCFLLSQWISWATDATSLLALGLEDGSH